MQAKRDSETGNTLVTLTPDELHVLIWGGPQDVVDGIDSMFRTLLVTIEDADMSEREYQERFGDLEAMYDRLRPLISVQGFSGAKT